MWDRFPRKFDVQTSYKPSNYVLGLIFVVNIKFSSGNLSHDNALDRRTLLFKHPLDRTPTCGLSYTYPRSSDLYYTFCFRWTNEISEDKYPGLSPNHFYFNWSEHEQWILSSFIPANKIPLRGTLGQVEGKNASSTRQNK